jgi:hypothetical protein
MKHKARDRRVKYRTAAEILWGPAGAWAVEEYGRLNSTYFDGALPDVPIVIGLTAYGRCIALTRYHGDWDAERPRITLFSPLFYKKGTTAVRDTLIHEMVHVKLVWEGQDAKHNAWPWCREIMRISPLYLGKAVKAKPIHPQRRGKTSVREQPAGFPDFLTRCQLAEWPDCLRRPGEEPGERLRVASY